MQTENIWRHVPLHGVPQGETGMIQINDEWRILNDEMNCELQRLCEVKPRGGGPSRKEWQFRGFYPTAPGDRGLKLAYQAAMELDCIANRDLAGIIAQMDEWHRIIANLNIGRPEAAEVRQPNRVKLAVIRG